MKEPEFGYIMLSRKIFDPETPDEWWSQKRKFSRFEAWVYVLQLAAFRQRRYQTTKYGEIVLERGEFVASLRHLAKRFGWSVMAVRTFLQYCEKVARLSAQRATQGGTVYLIVNYETYQSASKGRSTASSTSSSTPVAHLKHKREEGKEGKEEQTDVQVVEQHYLTLHPRRRPSDKDRALIAKRLSTYSAVELCEAITGNANDDWHKGKKKHDLSYVLRSNGEIDNFREKAVVPPMWDYVNECLTEYGERVTRPSAA